MDAWGRRERAFGVAQDKVMDDHVTIDRPFDPPDLDRHAGFQLQRRDLAYQEFLARLGVQGKQ